MNSDELTKMLRAVAIEQARLCVLLETRQKLQDMLAIIRPVSLSVESVFNGVYSSIKEFHAENPEGYAQYKRFMDLCLDVFYKFTPGYGLFPWCLDNSVLEKAEGCFRSRAPFSLNALHASDLRSMEREIQDFIEAIDLGLKANA